MTAPDAAGPKLRFFALDSLRAAAMLAGVVWHVMQTQRLEHSLLMSWLHSFRMPLFMLISGFFSHLMLTKYGLGPYLIKRWWRIGIPLIIGLFTLMPIFHRFDLGRVTERSDELDGALSFAQLHAHAPPYERRGPTVAELKRAERERARRDGADPAVRIPTNRLNQLCFGKTGRLFSLGHLWFLWYLLVFVSVAPLVAGFADWITTRGRKHLDHVSAWLVRVGLAPLVLALVSWPLMMWGARSVSWSLPLADGIDAVFPDFLFQYQVDWPFYFAFFMAGWWLHREKDSLPSIGRLGAPVLAFGIAMYVAFWYLATRYEWKLRLPNYEALRTVAYGASAVAAAYTSWGFVGVFQRYLDRPNRIARYFAETALWIYLIHQDVLGLVNRGLEQLALSRASHAFFAAVSTIAVGTLLYEMIIRPTPLVRIFGPGQRPPRRSRETLA